MCQMPWSKYSDLCLLLICQTQKLKFSVVKFLKAKNIKEHG